MTSQHKIETENAGLHSAEDVARAIREATNDDLRRKIAELEGWSDVYPNGGDPNVDTQWLGIKPPDRHESFLPDWLTDANAAMELVGKMNGDERYFGGVLIMYDRISEVWTAHLECHALERNDCVGKDPDIKVAICRLYVAWREAKDSNAPPDTKE